MVIVLDNRNTYTTDTALSIFTSACCHDIAALKTAHTFIFITNEDKPLAPFSENVKMHRLHKTNIRLYDQIRLKKELRNWQADRCIFLQNTGFFIAHINRGQYTAGSRLVQFAGNADAQPLKGLPPPIVNSIVPACKTAIRSLSWAASESIKTQYTGGRSYFIFIGNISEHHHLVDLLKAFSVFKKWQQSNMQLVVAGYPTAWTAVLEEKLTTYKYRQDIVLIKNPADAETAKLVAASYAVVHPSVNNIFPLGVLWAVQSGKAVIASGNDTTRKIATGAEWVPDNNTEEGFATAMKLLYKDEKHLQLLAQQNIDDAHRFDYRQMLEQVWACIEK